MQNFTNVSSATSLTASLPQLLDNDKTIMSCNAGAAFPTTNLLVGMLFLQVTGGAFNLFQLKSTGPDTWVKIADLTKTSTNQEYVDAALALKADIESPEFTGTVTLPAIIVQGDAAFTGTGAVKVPVGTTAERPTGEAGDLRFNLDTPGFEGHNGTEWGAIGGGGGGGGGVFVTNTAVLTDEYVVEAGTNALTAGPLEISEGAGVTVAEGSSWTVV